MEYSIDNKYTTLMSKIDGNRRGRKDDEAQSLLEKQDARVKGGHDEALKTLYDQSVNFKNDLAELRQRVKGLHGTTSKFNNKVEVKICLKLIECRNLRLNLRISEGKMNSFKRKKL